MVWMPEQRADPGKKRTTVSRSNPLAAQLAPSGGGRRTSLRGVDAMEKMIVPGMSSAWAPTSPTQPLTKLQRGVREHHLSSGQLLPYMTAREVHQRYQPLDADRIVNETGWNTNRPIKSGSVPTRGWGSTTGGSHEYRRQYRPGGAKTQSVWMSQQKPETDEELWGRKYEESTWSPSERYSEGAGGTPENAYLNTRGETTERSGTYRRVMRGSGNTATGQFPGMATPRSSQTYEPFEPHEASPLADVAREKGTAGLGPISLGSLGGPGSMGKPEVVGGHHRIAAMTMHAPNTLMPTAHFRDIQHARWSGGYT